MLTIAHHADPARVGEVAQLGTRREELSRLAPEFRRLGGADSGYPIADRFISRRPIVFDVQAQGVRIERDPGAIALFVDGVSVEQSCMVLEPQLEDGVVLRLGGRAVLVLHRGMIESRRAQDMLGLVGESAGMHRLRREILKVAAREVPVLLRGESGTGKELAARAIHQASERSEGPCVCVNIAAVHSSVAAAELFGHKKGAFTGAAEDRDGYFLSAQQGTLFLDEIGEANTDVQAMLLRALESKVIQPVGGAQERPVDVRLITATDADLEGAKKQGQFRNALYHRLAGYEIHLPPLRERREDIGLLLQSFLREELQGAREEDCNRWFPSELAARLLAFDWPGNVRQLKNVARQIALTMDEGPVELKRLLDRLLPEDEPDEPSPAAATASATRVAKTPIRARKPAEVSDEELVSALTKAKWRLERAATALGISRASLYRLIDAHPDLKTAKDLTEAELRACHKEAGGDLDRMSAVLKVSKSGVRQRLKELSI